MKIHYFGTNFTHAKSEWCARRVFEHYTFCYFLTPFLYEKDSKALVGNAGDFLIIPPSYVVHHGPTPDMTDGFENDWLYVSGKEIDKLLARYPLPLLEPFKVSSPVLLKQCITQIEKEFSRKEKGLEDKLYLNVAIFIIELWRSYISANTKDNVVNRLERARMKLLEDISVNTPLRELASYAGYSQSRFCALYLEKYKISPKAELMRERISEARRLLKFSDFSVEQIASILGFSSIGHFSRYFKKSTGIPPSEYRNRTICR